MSTSKVAIEMWPLCALKITHWTLISILQMNADDMEFSTLMMCVCGIAMSTSVLFSRLVHFTNGSNTVIRVIWAYL